MQKKTSVLLRLSEKMRYSNTSVRLSYPQFCLSASLGSFVCHKTSLTKYVHNIFYIWRSYNQTICHYFLFFNTEYSMNDVIVTRSLNCPPSEGDEKALPSSGWIRRRERERKRFRRDNSSCFGGAAQSVRGVDTYCCRCVSIFRPQKALFCM